jgi:hypothetical protein
MKNVSNQYSGHQCIDHHHHLKYFNNQEIYTESSFLKMFLRKLRDFCSFKRNNANQRSNGIDFANNSLVGCFRNF